MVRFQSCKQKKSTTRPDWLNPFLLTGQRTCLWQFLFLQCLISIIFIAISVDIRLIDGVTQDDGRVEVLVDGTWGTVCDNSWDWKEATVVCTQLGKPNQTAYASYNAYHGRGSGEPVLEYLRCFGDETSLVQCGHYGLGVGSCSSGNEAGVFCFEGKS